jgi:hypothetical protein
VTHDVSKFIFSHATFIIGHDDSEKNNSMVGAQFIKVFRFARAENFARKNYTEKFLRMQKNNL